MLANQISSPAVVSHLKSIEWMSSFVKNLTILINSIEGSDTKQKIIAADNFIEVNNLDNERDDLDKYLKMRLLTCPTQCGIIDYDSCVNYQTFVKAAELFSIQP